ncbi:hypothetical protein FA13DRAFT_1748727 [Coprinellus micaceus]|uniref:hydroxymethylglutaryl-CoA reductase (NADPH) n=1 Tax=Coprinellus micaceus TaxID=71717 RepID=A0A4Y7RR92_COPMI|nr:hypothetical protein FA13DRAFT_1748727 [Coprinellus micaceus]
MSTLTAQSSTTTTSFSAHALDLKLKQVRLAHPEQSLPSPPSSNGASSPVERDYFYLRSLKECVEIYEDENRGKSESLAMLSDEEVVLLADNGKVAPHALEKLFGMNELERAVRVRRAIISRSPATKTLESSSIPYENYDYSRVIGACCENVVGYIPIPLGVAGPLNVNGTSFPIPMATAEGTLVASTSRGCKALNAGGGVSTVLVGDAMTRGPAIDFPSIKVAAQAKAWVDSAEGYAEMKAAFESTSRFAKLKSLKTAMAGRTMGKSVVAEAVIPGHIVKTVLKTTVGGLCNLNVKKNLIGSAMAGSIGGFNAHASNILTAIFLATGQDPAQNVESSMCMTLMEPTNNGEDLLCSVTMPCIEVGTVGGGTVLAAQQGVLEMLGVKGAHPQQPGKNAQTLARVIASAVLAGELSLLSALAAGHLIKAHMAHNRSQVTTPAASVPVTPGPRV